MNDIKQALQAGAEWMETNKNHPDAEAFGCVAAAMAQLSQVAYGNEKETAGDAAVESFGQTELSGSLNSKTFFRDWKVLERASTDILATLIKRGILRREIEDVFQMVKDTVDNQAISVSAHIVR